jgi:geranylgeranyl reductase family protein
VSGARAVVDEAEFAVVGAGPAGSACAARLAELGHDVLLIDQGSFPREKPCGDGLTPSAVAFLRRYGLDPVIDQSYPIAGLRGVLDYRHSRFRDFGARRGESACCVPRGRLDDALREAALARGARFMRARAQGPAIVDDGVEGVIVRGDDGEAQVAARYVVAADGATSRMRREAGFTRPPNVPVAYGVRQYFRTERRLEPSFDVYVPVEHEGVPLLGYGWVFPVSEHLANVGVGVWRVPGVDNPPPLRTVLSRFVEDLRLRAGRRVGDMEPTGEPLGSPLATNFTRERCQLRNMLFVGDAASTTDPITGEGIAYALFGGELVANVGHDAARRGDRAPDPGLLMARRFPRLGQDISLVTRGGLRYGRELMKGEIELGGNTRLPFVKSIARMALEAEEEPTLTGTPVRRTLADLDQSCADDLDELNNRTLDLLRTRFPFASELLHRELRAHAGPLYGSVLLLANRACGGTPGEVLPAALAIECVRIVGRISTLVADPVRNQQARFNNAMAVLISDFAVSRAALAASEHGQNVVSGLARAACSMCEGGMLDVEDRYDLERTPERYFAASAATAGAVVSTAARLGAELALAGDDQVAELADYGWHVGMASQVADDVVRLLAGDDQTAPRPGTDLRWGIYTLPVVYGLQRDARLKRMLARGIEKEDLPEAVAAIRESGAIEAAVRDCEQHVASATAIVERLALNGAGDPLVAVAELALERVRTAAGPAGEPSLAANA